MSAFNAKAYERGNRRLVQFLGWTLIWSLFLVMTSWVAMAQFSPMPLYEHPARGQHDPYAQWPNCCSGGDCTPWDGADIEVTVNGYYIRSLDVEVTDQKKIKPSFNGQYHVCKPVTPGDNPRAKSIINGKSMIYCLFVPMGM